MYIDKLDDIVNNSNNAYHKTIKMKPSDIKSSTYFDFEVENNGKDPKFEIGDYLRISKHKNFFGTGYTPNRPEDVFVI